jgi:hypothetical protein
MATSSVSLLAGVTGADCGSELVVELSWSSPLLRRRK